MTAIYNFDIFSSLDGYGSRRRRLDRLLEARPELLDHRLRPVQRGAADGVRQHVPGVRADDGFEHRGVRSA